jgi:hypothetical protein
MRVIFPPAVMDAGDRASGLVVGVGVQRLDDSGDDEVKREQKTLRTHSRTVCSGG